MLFHYLGGGLAISFTLLWQLPGQKRTLRIQKPFEWGSSIQERVVVGMGVLLVGMVVEVELKARLLVWGGRREESCQD